ncbi:aldose 1-epimerase family protein [Weissella coleopterorum]|uniref:Aldose 1-epimerase family protein n=1 Tax=Weissella coleopterorum TaxID=2714949 RepID=A0A6G8AZT7_9LACO|nr:aldose 1-epimerase family protein [Weissella coleopterorum]QIL50578.1 aldose 1-epimerase family protein [Weissella coleopterorum]
MLYLENEKVRVAINEIGAELSSIYLKEDETEYLWQANSTFWGRHAPQLFPIVGRLKENKYQFSGEEYQMSQHGFARDNIFNCIEIKADLIQLRLIDSPETRQQYPFKFQFDVIFTLSNSGELGIKYVVENIDQKVIYFGLGGHPGFNIPLSDRKKFEDYHLELQPDKVYQRKILNGPFLDEKQTTGFDATKSFPLKRADFKNDAIILDLDKQPIKIKIIDDEQQHGVVLSIKNAKFAGIWTKYDVEAPFICIEPWWGIADTIDATGQLVDKFSINQLDVGAQYLGEYSIQVF